MTDFYNHPHSYDHDHLPLPVKIDTVRNPFKESFDNSDLDFEVTTSPIYLATNEEKYGEYGSDECMDKQAVVKLHKDGSVEDWWVVGKDYFVKSHRDFYESIEEKMIERFDPNHIASVEIKTKSSRNGRWGLREYMFDSISIPVTTTNNFKTTIKFRIVAWSGLDGMTANNYLLGAFDSYCMNGCVWSSVGETDYTRMKKRNSKLFNLDYFSDTLVTASEDFYNRSEEFQTMAQTRLTPYDGLSFLEELKASGKKIEGFKDLYLNEVEVRGENVFALHSALTNYSSHQNEDKFSTRKTKYFSDQAPELMFKREEEVTNILQSKEWAALLNREAA